MELAICQTCQILRRAGKRFVTTKLGNHNNTTDQDIRPNKQTLREKVSYSESLTVTHAPRTTFRNLYTMSPVEKNCFLSSSVSSKFLQIPKYSIRFPPIRHIRTVAPIEWLAPSDIEEVLEHRRLPFKKGYTCYITKCESCCQQDDVMTTYVNNRNGNVLCRNCGLKYDWKSFKNRSMTREKTKSHTLKPQKFEFELQNPNEHLSWSSSKKISEKSKERFSCYELHKIYSSTFEQFNVRISGNDDSLILPYYDITKQHVVSLKKYFVGEEQPIIVKNSDDVHLFGWQNIEPEQNEVVLTSNEFDSLAVTQATRMPSLALPFGASALPPEILPFLEQFDKIYLWFRNEYQAKENLHKFAAKLSLSRCYLVSSNETNGGALNALNNCGSELVESLIRESRSMAHDHIVTFNELSNELYSELVHAEQNAGVPFTRFPVLNEYLKGHRRGELTIFTGPTGSGKTTFLSELSLDLCMQGVNTLWGSFEIKNVRLLNIMMHQYSGFALEKNMEKFPEWSEQFESLPLYFMNYYGAQDLKQVLQTIEYAIYTYDIEHIVIDNLQFMTTVSNGEDRFQLMDRAISSFRRCASDNNVHITIVVHPRKENEGNLLQTASIYGSAKASQEADNVLILQTSDNLSMQVSKNRFSGSIGTIPLSFHPESLCLSGFYRNLETNEGILPALRVKRPVKNLKIISKKTNYSK